jgi:hypothetical protein
MVVEGKITMCRLIPIEIGKDKEAEWIEVGRLPSIFPEEGAFSKILWMSDSDREITGYMKNDSDT